MKHSKNERNQAIFAEFVEGDTTQAELARKYCISPERIRQILRAQRRHKRYLRNPPWWDGLRSRVARILMRYEVNSVEDLREISVESLYRMESIGHDSVDQILEWLESKP